MQGVKHVMDFLTNQRQAASGLREFPAVIPDSRSLSLHGPADAVVGTPDGIDSAIPSSSSLTSSPVFGIGASSGEPVKPAVDVLQPATDSFNMLKLADLLGSVTERVGGGDAAEAAELAEQRIVHAMILKLHLKAESETEESMQPDAVCNALHVCPHLIRKPHSDVPAAMSAMDVLVFGYIIHLIIHLRFTSGPEYLDNCSTHWTRWR